jgi:hypothetical protein
VPAEVSFDEEAEMPTRTTPEVTPSTARRISVAAWVMAAFGTVAGELHALARINSHPEDLEYPLTRAWAEPAMDALRPLLDWSDPRFVYWTYGKIWLPVCLAFTAAAYLVYRTRSPRGAERTFWRIQLGAYGLLTLSVTGDYFTPWTEQFFVVGLVALLVIGLGGPLLGIILLRRGFRPRSTCWLLVGFLPFFFAITQITSMGNALLPLMWGWAFAAHRVSRIEQERADETEAPGQKIPAG